MRTNTVIDYCFMGFMNNFYSTGAICIFRDERACDGIRFLFEHPQSCGEQVRRIERLFEQTPYAIFLPEGMLFVCVGVV